ncbi:MAG TPA: hypothetical protein VKE98_02125 [Gemmataceae bacterium]|nr:hypothetical protein [Gemmataceae bacterium]
MDPDSGTNSGNLSLGEGDPLLASLEQRVQRLEDAVVVLQEGAGKPQVKAGPAPKESDHIMAGNRPEQTPVPASKPVTTRPPWLIVDILNETRTMVRMFFDIRYRVGWFTRLFVIILLAMIFTSGLWFPLAYIPWLGTPFDKIIDVLLAFLTYKILSREARRYMASQREVR